MHSQEDPYFFIYKCSRIIRVKWARVRHACDANRLARICSQFARITWIMRASSGSRDRKWQVAKHAQERLQRGILSLEWECLGRSLSSRSDVKRVFSPKGVPRIFDAFLTDFWRILERSSFPNKTRPILTHFWRISDAFMTHSCYCRGLFRKHLLDDSLWGIYRREGGNSKFRSGAKGFSGDTPTGLWSELWPGISDVTL